MLVSYLPDPARDLSGVALLAMAVAAVCLIFVADHFRRGGR